MAKASIGRLSVLGGTALLAAAAGFAVARLAPDRQARAKPLEVLAECGFAAGEAIRGSTLKLRCGLDQVEIEALFAAAVADLKLGGGQDAGAPTREQLAAAGERLGLTVEAAEALLAGLRAGPAADGAAVDWGIEVAVAEGAAEGALPVRFDPKDLVVDKAESADEATLLSRVRAKCGTAVGEAIADSVVEIICGPSSEEVDALIRRFIEASGAGGLQDVLRDEAARRELMAELGASFGLDDALIEALVAELQQASVSDEEAVRRLDDGLRAGMQQALLLLKIGATGDELKARQADLAAAIVAGDGEAAARIGQETGEMLRPLADDLAPPPTVVVAAQAVVEAQREAAAGDYPKALRGLAQAAEKVRGDWPLIADNLRLVAASILTDDRALAAANASFGEESQDASVRVWLEVSMALRATAVDLGLSAAGRLNGLGEHSVDDALLAQAGALLDRLAPLVDREADPAQFVSLQAGRAAVLRERAERSGELALFRQAEAAASDAVGAAEALGEQQVIQRLTEFGRIEMALARATGEASYFDAASDAFARVAAASDAAGDLSGWALARNNVAVVDGDRASRDHDTALMTKVVDIYREIAARVDPNTDAWALYTRNLGGALTTLGGWEGSPERVREAIDELEKLRIFNAERGVDLSSADGLQQLSLAWWQLGFMERDSAAFDRAAELMSEAIAIYDPATAPGPRVAAQLQLGRLLNDRASVASNATGYVAAAEAFAAARAFAAETGQAQVQVQAALFQAGSLARAQGLAPLPAGVSDPAEPVAEARRIIGEVPEGEVTQEWERLRKDAAALEAEVK